MLHRIFRALPWIMLTVAITLAGTIQIFRSSIHQWQLQLIEVQSAYLSVITETRSTLNRLLRDVSRDVLGSNNIDWSQNNALSKSLAAKLRRGEMDAVEIIDSDCNILAQASLLKNETQGCKYF